MKHIIFATVLLLAQVLVSQQTEAGALSSNTDDNASVSNLHGARTMQHAQTQNSAPYLHAARYRDSGLPGKPNGYYVNMTKGDTVALPASLTSKLPACGQLSFGEPVEGKWYKDDAGHWAFELDKCRLWRPTGDVAAQCLAGQRIVMIGDSVTRYQYTSLLHFLASKQYHNPYDDGQASVSNKYQWRSWPAYYQGAARLITRLVSRAAQGRATCECQHGAGKLPFEVWRFHMNLPGADKAGGNLPRQGQLGSMRATSTRGARGGQRVRGLLDGLWGQISLQPHEDVLHAREVLGTSSGLGALQDGAGAGGSIRCQGGRGGDERNESLQQNCAAGGTSYHTRGLSTPAADGTAAVPSEEQQQQVVADFYYVYKFPSFLVAGLEGLAWAFNERPPQPIVHRTANSEVRRNGEAVEGGQARKGGSVEGQRLNAASDSADKRGGSESSSESYWRQPNWRPPSVLVFNMGIFWSIQGGDNLEDVMETMFKYAGERAHKYGTRLIWKTTTAPSWDAEPSMNDLAVRLARKHGFEIYDVRAVAAAAEAQHLEIKWDVNSAHFLPVAYEQFNDLMLSVMCPIDAREARSPRS